MRTNNIARPWLNRSNQNSRTTIQFDTATAESQENEMFDADVDAAESSNILPEPISDATSASTQTATARLEQQTIDFFKIHSPQVNFKDATKTPANESATFPTIVLYCPTFVGGMPMPPLWHQPGMQLQNRCLRQRPRTQDKTQREKRGCMIFCKLEYCVGSKTRMRKGIERYCSIVGFLNEAGRLLKNE
jgi:hypothetical protein